MTNGAVPAIGGGNKNMHDTILREDRGDEEGRESKEGQREGIK